MPNFKVWPALFLIAAAVMAAAAPADALPVFAHRYGFSCQQCHTTVPNLNAFGRYFLEHGFRLQGAPARGTFPVAVKVETAYGSGSGDDEDAGGAPLPKAVVDEVEILSAGSIGRNASYYFEQYAVDGGMPGRPRDMWIDLAQPLHGDFSGPALHARMGEFTLPLPVDPETQRPTLAGYALFSQSVGSNAFTLFDPRVGLDAYYTDYSRGVQAHLVAAQAVDRGSGFASTGVDLMASASKSLGDRFTLSAYRYQGQRRTGAIEDRFARSGYAVGYGYGKFDATGLLQQGYDTSADGYGLLARSSGGFLQTAWHFSDALSLYARYDDTYDPFNLRSGTGTLSLVTRPARNMRFTVEGSRTGGGTYGIAGGLLFAY